MSNNTLSRYLVQRRQYLHTINSGGYPDGPLAWTAWSTTVDFEDRQRAINIASTLADCANFSMNDRKCRYRDTEFRCFDSVTGETLALKPTDIPFIPYGSRK